MALAATGLCFAFTGGATPAFAAEYRLQPGDVVDISVSGLPELTKKAVVGLEGQIVVPLSGPLQVSGMTIGEMRSRIQDILATKAVRQRTMDGRETAVAIGRDEISADIADYVPVYVTGDVTRSGEIRFRPGMSVIQAISLAGGYDAGRLRGAGLLTQTVQLKSDYEAMATELAKEEAHVARLQAVIDGKSELKATDLPASPPGNQSGQTPNDLELQKFRVMQTDTDKQRAYLEQAVKKSDAELAILAEQQKKEMEGVEMDQKEFESVQELFKKGMVAIGRVTDSRRSVLLSSTRLLQSNVRLSQLNREREDSFRQMQKLDDDRRSLAITELQEASFRVSTLKTRLAAVAQQAIYVGAARQVASDKMAKPDLAIVRKGAAGAERVPADESAVLAPGDVVIVAIPVDPAFLGVAQPGRDQQGVSQSELGPADLNQVGSTLN